MKAGKVVADGPAQHVFGNASLVEGAGLQSPQLVAMARLLGQDTPFQNVAHAVEWLAQR
jgi:hypothetical protein